MSIHNILTCAIAILAFGSTLAPLPAEAALFGKSGKTTDEVAEAYAELNAVTDSLIEELGAIVDEESAKLHLDSVESLVAKRKELLKSVAKTAALHPIKAKRYAKENGAAIAVQEGKLKFVTAKLYSANYYGCAELGSVLSITGK